MKTYGNCKIVTMNPERTVIEQGYISIEKDKIIDIGTMETCPSDYIDKNGSLCIPGMINGHTHLGLFYLRSMADDLPNRLKQFLFPMEAQYYDSETIESGTAMSAYESLLSGITCVVDMYYEAEKVCEVLKEVGIRALVGQTIINDHPLAANVTQKSLEDFIIKYRNEALVRPLLAPHAPYSVDLATLKQINSLSEQYEVLKMMHLSEMDFEMKQFEPLSPIQYLDENNILDNRWIAVHCIYTDENDQQILKKNEVKVVSCPNANMKSGKGIADIKGFLEHDIQVCLGTDGPISSNTLDLMSVMKTAAYGQKTKYQQRDLLPSQKVFEMVTCDAAKVFNMDYIGSLEIGKQADLVFIDTTAVNMMPIYDVYASLVYSLSTRNIETVVVAGKELVKDFKIVNQEHYQSTYQQALNTIDRFKKIYQDSLSS